MNFEVDGVKYLNERATATQQTGFWFVAQARQWLPDPVGGILWFGVDDAATSALTPIYCATTEVPECFSEENGSMLEYSPTSAFWLVNRVANFAYLRYNRVAADIRKNIDEWENARIAEVANIDKVAADKFKKSPKAAIKYTTAYSVARAEELFERWTALDGYLLTKYVDGNIKAETEQGFKDNGHDPKIPGGIIFEGYGDAWKRAVAASDDGTLRVPEEK
jgi:dipeptidase